MSTRLEHAAFRGPFSSASQAAAVKASRARFAVAPAPGPAAELRVRLLSSGAGKMLPAINAQHAAKASGQTLKRSALGRNAIPRILYAALPLRRPRARAQHQRERCLRTAARIRASRRLTLRCVMCCSKKIREAVNHGGRTIGGVHIHTFEDTFSTIDENGDGTVSPLEFKHAMHKLGFRLNQTQLENLVEYVDADGNGTIDYTEFVTQITRKDFGIHDGDAVQNGTLHVMHAANLKSADTLDVTQGPSWSSDRKASDPYCVVWYASCCY